MLLVARPAGELLPFPHDPLRAQARLAELDRLTIPAGRWPSSD